jgi:predicted XRE-type DNA-binding protein
MDWKTLITDLQAAGLTQLEIGKQIGLSQPSVVDVIRGRTKDLKWSIGQALISLHAKKVGAGDTAPEPHQEAA